MRQTQIEMVWPHLPSPKQMDNSTEADEVNDTIIARKIKSMDLQLHWLRYRETQQQNHFHWAPGSNN